MKGNIEGPFFFGTNMDEAKCIAVNFSAYVTHSNFVAP